MRMDPFGLRLGTGLVFMVALACQSAGGPQHNTGGGNSTVHPAGGNSSNGGTGTGGASALPSEVLALSTVSAHVDGRRGNRVRLTISGQQTLGKLASVAVLALDSNANPITFFDTDLNGAYDSATGYYVPQPMPDQATFSFDLLVPLTSELLDWKKAEVFLVDRTDAISAKITADVQAQPVRTKGTACDITSKADRCADGFECDGTTNACVSHQRPSLSQVGYYTTTNGPLLIASGLDAMDDVTEMRINFYDSNGSPVYINITNDTTNPLMAASFDESGGIFAVDGAFIFRINPSAEFIKTVKQVSLVPLDAQRKQGDALSASLLPQPSRGSGAACDYLGSNYCSGNSACVPGIAGEDNACLPLGSAQAAACRNAPVIGPEANLSVVVGNAVGTSIWEPPSSCAPDTALHNAEFVAKLHMAKAMPSITLTTRRRETQIDTVLYIASVCSPTNAQIMACNDDLSGSSTASTLTLTNLAAGDYYVIVDSRTGAEGSVGLQVSVP